MPVRAAMAGLAVQHGSLFRPERIRFAASLAYSQTQRASRPLNLGATRAKSRTGALVRRQRLEVSLKRFQLAAEEGPVRLVWQAWGLNAEWFRTRAQAAQHHLQRCLHRDGCPRVASVVPAGCGDVKCEPWKSTSWKRPGLNRGWSRRLRWCELSGNGCRSPVRVPEHRIYKCKFAKARFLSTVMRSYERLPLYSTCRLLTPPFGTGVKISKCEEVGVSELSW